MVRCMICEQRMGTKKKSSFDKPNEEKMCRQCSMICELEIYHLTPIEETSKGRQKLMWKDIEYGGERN